MFILSVILLAAQKTKRALDVSYFNPLCKYFDDTGRTKDLKVPKINRQEFMQASSKGVWYIHYPSNGTSWGILNSPVVAIT